MDHPQLRAALAAVRDACLITRQVQQRTEEIRQASKDDRSPVTVADYAVQAVCALALANVEPNLKLVGEEQSEILRRGENDDLCAAVVETVRMVVPKISTTAVLDAIDMGAHDGSAARFWTLDPIDGTKGFLRGGQYAIALGLIENGTVSLGFMGCPNLPAKIDAPIDAGDSRGVIYAAMRGNGAWVYDGEDTTISPKPIAIRRAEGPFRICESVEASHSRHSDTARLAHAIGGESTSVRADSQCKYALVARGQADAYLRFPTSKSYVEKIWDHAAGFLVATEAGAIVTDISGAKLDFNHGRLLEKNRGIICATPAYHADIINLIKSFGIAD